MYIKIVMQLGLRNILCTMCEMPAPVNVWNIRPVTVIMTFLNVLFFNVLFVFVFSGVLLSSLGGLLCHTERCYKMRWFVSVVFFWWLGMAVLSGQMTFIQRSLNVNATS